MTFPFGKGSLYCYTEKERCVTEEGCMKDNKTERCQLCYLFVNKFLHINGNSKNVEEELKRGTGKNYSE